MLRSRLRNLPAPSVPAPDLHEDLNTEINESPEDVFGAFRSQLFPEALARNFSMAPAGAT